MSGRRRYRGVVRVVGSHWPDETNKATETPTAKLPTNATAIIRKGDPLRSGYSLLLTLLRDGGAGGGRPFSPCEIGYNKGSPMRKKRRTHLREYRGGTRGVQGGYRGVLTADEEGEEDELECGEKVLRARPHPHGGAVERSAANHGPHRHQLGGQAGVRGVRVTVSGVRARQQVPCERHRQDGLPGRRDAPSNLYKWGDVGGFVGSKPSFSCTYDCAGLDDEEHRPCVGERQTLPKGSLDVVPIATCEKQAAGFPGLHSDEGPKAASPCGLSCAVESQQQGPVAYIAAY
eukprot:248636-Prorocentrum_minimum.AAC.3